jgi:hypothetical protein
MFKTSDYFDYLNFMLTTIFDILPNFQKKDDPASLSAVLLLSYVLNSLVHASPTRFKNQKYTPLKNYVRDHRCSKNPLLFLPSLFKMHGNTIKCNFILPIPLLQLYYPNKKLTMTSSNTNILSITTRADNPSFDQLQSTALQSILDPSSNYARRQRFFTPDLELYDMKKTETRTYATNARAIFEKYGLSNIACLLFFQLFFTEWFLHLNSRNCFVDKDLRPSFKFFAYDPAEYGEILYFQKKFNVKYQSSKKSSCYARQFMVLLPFPPSLASFTPSVDCPSYDMLIQSLIQKSSKSRWSQYGSRAMYLQLFMNKSITYAELQDFHMRFLFLVYTYLRFFPCTDIEKLHKSMNQPMVRATRDLPSLMVTDRTLKYNIDIDTIKELLLDTDSQTGYF